ncbi:MAG TPA: TIGR02266 family protein [Polyangiaceae bacterium]|jgi:uncharacterized protein (TIGR02266 family)|nr:TIGR02266 family protein [Polyangiaceae bacterium]
MTQDTRKDRRVKIVSLNVRYKSATVDEFIENHALDVSRGGIYIKTGSPFPPGTLLKFEIRLASDQALITGVGRVVWKRDSGQGTGDRPSGMGVKFIKVDDPSKAVIDKLVNTRTDAGRAYESESETPSPEAQTPIAASAARTPAPAPAANRNIGKSTMLGMGAVSAASATGSRSTSGHPGTPSNAPRAKGGGMFPETNSEADMPPKQEQTVMKQAAELLEEALREAGGTMEDVGNNPLFAGSPAPAPAAAEPPGPEPIAAGEPKVVEHKTTSLVPGDRPSTGPEAVRARAMVAEMAPAPPKKTSSEPPRTTRDAPISRVADRTSVPAGRVSVRPAPRVSSTPPSPPKKGGSGLLILLGVAAAAGVVGVVYRDTLFGQTAPATPEAPPSVQAAATTPPMPLPTDTASAAVQAPAPSATDSASAAAAASAAPSASASAGPHASASAGASAAPVAAPVHPTPHPVYAPKPVTPAPTATVTAAATSTTAPEATATAAPTTTATAAPTAAPTSTTTATSTATSTMAPTKPKATKPSDDNPY